MRRAKIDNFSLEELTDIVKSSRSLQEVLQKTGYSSVSGTNRQTVQARLDNYQIDTGHFNLCGGGIKRNFENIFIENSTATPTVMRRHYLKGEYSPYICAICGQEPIWNNKSLSLTLDHINGNNTDHRLENLRWICPNCDRQLNTFGSKNKRNNG